MAATTDRRKRSLGIAAYFAVATTVAARVRPFGVRLVIDGVVHETDALAVLVANAGELVPGLLRPRLPLVPDDGLLDILVARGGGPLGGSRGALELLLGRGVHTAVGPYAGRFAGRSVEVVADGDEPVEVDGDVVGTRRLVAEVVPGALRVLVPA
jgi:diacylglycerol kinase family enzyme